jgi:RimJ/RimL family protein N-acetyltransferase
MILIRKARAIIGNLYRLRNVDESDAAFIVALRTDEHKRRYISETSAELAQQIAWIKQYERDVGQAYFVIESMSGERAGTIRMYDQKEDGFCFGSWIVKRGMPAACAVESILILYHYALDVLGFSRSYFAVRKPNRSVWRFMEQFGARRTGETEVDYWYQTERTPVQAAFKRYAKFLPHPIRVIDDPVS